MQNNTIQSVFSENYMENFKGELQSLSNQDINLHASNSELKRNLRARIYDILNTDASIGYKSAKENQESISSISREMKMKTRHIGFIDALCADDIFRAYAATLDGHFILRDTNSGLPAISPFIVTYFRDALQKYQAMASNHKGGIDDFTSAISYLRTAELLVKYLPPRMKDASKIKGTDEIALSAYIQAYNAICRDGDNGWIYSSVRGTVKDLLFHAKESASNSNASLNNASELVERIEELGKRAGILESRGTSGIITFPKRIIPLEKARQ